MGGSTFFPSLVCSLCGSTYDMETRMKEAISEHFLACKTENEMEDEKLHDSYTTLHKVT